MQFKNYFPLFALALLLVACGEGSDYQKTSVGNFDIQFIEDEAGESPNVGDFVEMYATIESWKEGDPEDQRTVVWSNERNNGGKSVKYQIPDPSDVRLGRPTADVAALLEMSPGDSIVTFDLADSMTRKPPGDFTHLYYNIRLLTVQSEAEYQRIEGEKMKEMEAKAATIKDELNLVLADYRDNKLGDRLVDIGNGMKKVVLEEGNGTQPELGDEIAAMYYGALVDGTRFDDSYSRGEPYSFALGTGSVIQGWHKGFATMTEKEKAILFIPPALGYGAAGSPPRIPGDSELAFLVELTAIN